MNQIKIGKFIAECRKAQNLTQSNLAEHFGISDRAVSKWETGRCLPDAGIMLELCALLKINVNELLQGEKITMENYETKAEETIIELTKKNEKASKNVLICELIITILLILMFIGADLVIHFLFPSKTAETLVNIFGPLVIIVFALYLLKLEQNAGYYKCKECGATFIPPYKQVLMAPHIGWTRKMKCPNCGKKTWNKKVLSVTD